MKNNLILFAMILTVLFMGCNKNDDSISPVNELADEPPLSFSLLEVSDGATDVDVTPTLSWESAKNPDGGEVTYNLYLDQSLDPTTLIEGNLGELSFEVNQSLNHLSEYHWKVVATDTEGRTSLSPIQSFTTRYYRFSDEPVNPDAEFAARSSHTSVVFDDKMWVVGGSAYLSRVNDVWHSEDGFNWTEVTPSAEFSERAGHSTSVYNNKMWVIGGIDIMINKFNDVWSSEDGKTWTETTSSAPFSGRWGHKSVVFDNKLWLIGGNSTNGYENDVWHTQDGAIWTPATLSADFPERSHHAVVVFDGKIWVIGGIAGNVRLNDVWYSSDGINWTEATNSVPFSKRFGHSATVLDNKIWVIAGNGEIETRIKDIWYSSNGVDWKEVTNGAPFSGRFRHTSVVYENKLWLIGGVSPQSAENDVWVMD